LSFFKKEKTTGETEGMDGGALIGHGTFGCVFDPPLRVVSKTSGECKTIDTPGRIVGKISEPEEVKNEIEASKILSEVRDNSLYFSIVDLNNINRPCDTAEQKDADKESLKECPIVQRVDMSNMLHFTMPYSGIGLSKYFNVHLKNNKPIPVEKAITHLLEAASLLILNNLVHYDIHSENVLFDKTTNMPRIIDFGFSFSVTNINKETLSTRWKVYTPDYPTEAPELAFIQGLRHKLSADTVIYDIISGKKPIKTCQFVLGMRMDAQERSFRDFLKKSKSIQESDWTGFFKYYWPGFDAWGIGAVILKIYLYISQVQTYTKDASWKELSEKMKSIIRALLRVNPIERIDCVEALYMFNPESHIFQLERATSWIQERSNFRKPFSI